MTGYNEILDARLTWFTPEYVWVHLLDHVPTEFDHRWAEEALENDFRATIIVPPTDRIGRLNLMALMGLTVVLNGTDELRVMEFFYHLATFHPKLIVTMVNQEIIIAEAEIHAEH